ncbi:unnamed protein product [Lampetra fluviatilis]
MRSLFADARAFSASTTTATITQHTSLLETSRLEEEEGPRGFPAPRSASPLGVAGALREFRAALRGQRTYSGPLTLEGGGGGGDFARGPGDVTRVVDFPAMSSGERIDAAAAAAAAFNGSASTRTPGGNRSKEYYWDFEYYDYEPISFEGLRAHRYSIVIGFWVGIASFVLFMFFILVMLVRSGTTDDRRRCSSRGPSVRRRAHALPRSPKAGEMSSVIEPGFGNRRGDDDADEEEEEEMAAMTCIHRELRPGRAALLHAEQECPAAIAMATTTTTTTAAATATSILYHSDSFDIPNLISESRVDAASGAADVRPSLSD